MIVTDHLKIIDYKIKVNQVQYDLGRLAAKISSQSSGELRKYEYLTGEDLDTNQVCLNKLNSTILYWVRFLLRDWIKMIEKKDS